jgi:hypothetical protein
MREFENEKKNYHINFQIRTFAHSQIVSLSNLHTFKLVN